MDADQLARFERLLTRQDITDCLMRFCRGMDRFDRDLFLSAFHPSAEIAAGDFVGGPADLYEWAHQMHERGQIATQHNLLNNTCDIDGDAAHSETYYLFAARNLDESNWIAGGRYFDRLDRLDGQWRIMLRTNVIEWVRSTADNADTVRRRARHRCQRHFSTEPKRSVLQETPGQPSRHPQPADVCVTHQGGRRRLPA